MTLPVFEAACVAIVALTLATMSRARPARELFRDYAVLALAAFVGEDTCIAFYGFYTYAPGWHLRLHHVPALVPTIWPLVVLSARSVVHDLSHRADDDGPRLLRSVAVGALVAFDASLVEVVAVRAGLWTWAEPGHLGVPIVGILGWGYFAFGADVALARKRPLLAILGGPLATHALVLVSWWALFRWTVRGDVGLAGFVALGGIALVATVTALRGRRHGHTIGIDVAAPRMIAATLFVALLVTTAPGDAALWAHTACVALPYFAATSFDLAALKLRGRRSAADRRGATAPSPR